MTEVRFLELHSDLFHAGKNFGKKITPKSISGITLNYDPKEKWFEITYMGRIGYIFSNNCSFWEPYIESVSVPIIVNEHKTEDKSKRSKAQVSTPQSHVFEGRR